jgi:hypothetical protein
MTTTTGSPFVFTLDRRITSRRRQGTKRKSTAT